MGTHPFPYRLIRSNRKTLAIQVSASGQVTVRAPRTMSDTTIENFLTQRKLDSEAPLPRCIRTGSVSWRKPPALRFPPQLLYGICPKNIQKKTAAYAKNERNLRPYHYPGTENTLGKLHQ